MVYDILSCRTAYLGGHLEKCDHYGLERSAYNCCRNRHCPKCQKGIMKKFADLPQRFGQNPYYLIHHPYEPTGTQPTIIFDFGMQACYILYYFGTTDKTLNVICLR